MSDKAIEIKNLVTLLNHYSDLYYIGKPEISDKEFDTLLEQLKTLEEETGIIYADSPTANVGSVVLGEVNKVDITDKPMLSLDKVHSAKEVETFSDGYDMIASIKCDGLSTRLIYENGELISANTRGNGYQGGDVTEHVKQFLNVPLKINKAGRYIIDGESVILQKDFEIINKNGQFKNPRNTASGSLALLDTSIVKQRRLSFIAWDVIEGGKSNSFYHYNLEEAEDLGFTVVPAAALDCTNVLTEQIDELNKDLLNRATEMGIPCDGVVWRINDIKAGAMKGQTAHHFLNAIAWKPQIEEYETYLLDIEWSMGRTGVLTPVAIFQPVEADGSTLERASLHNLSVLKATLGEYPENSQRIWVAKMNEIIPQITRAEKNNLKHEHIIVNAECSVCPICGQPTEVVESDGGVLNVVCKNPACEGKLANRIDHFFGEKGLNVKGISMKTIEKLINWGWVNGIKDVYDLEKHRSEWESKAGFGKASVEKILSAINTTGRCTKLESFISALGIPLVGKTIAKEISKYYSTWEDFREAVGGDWTILEGFGEELNKAINTFNFTEADLIAAGITFVSSGITIGENTAAALKDKIFCITGKVYTFKNRDELKADIESYGGKVVGSMSSKVNYLINNDAASSSAKNKAAQAAGIPIITEEEYIQMRGE